MWLVIASCGVLVAVLIAVIVIELIGELFD